MTKDDLRRELAASRTAIQRDYTGLCHELNFVARTKEAVVQKPLPWLGGAAAIGYILAGRRRAKKNKKKGQGKDAEEATKITALGILIGLIRFLFPLVKPALSSFAANKLGEYASRRFNPGSFH